MKGHFALVSVLLLLAPLTLAACEVKREIGTLPSDSGPEPPPPQDGGPTACIDNTLRCNADSSGRDRCTSGTWTPLDTCPNGALCTAATCGACAPNRTWCDPTDATQANLCNPAGTELTTITCVNNATCNSNGECAACTPNTSRCSPDGTTLQVCRHTPNPSSAWEWQNAGDGLDELCMSGLCDPNALGGPACVHPECMPGEASCQGTTTLVTCSPQGLWERTDCTTVPGLQQPAQCWRGQCIDECGIAAQEESYLGCEYWSAIQDNPVDRLWRGGIRTGQGTVDSNFAFVAANPSSDPAEVKVYRWFNGAEQLVKTVTVDGLGAASRGLAVINVPWQSLGDSGTETPNVAVTGTARYGYRLVSNRPVTMYQFNTLDAAKFTTTPCTPFMPFENSPDCTDQVDWNYPNKCLIPPTGGTQRMCEYFTYSNDASLLLPAHALGKSHVIVAPEHIAHTPAVDAAPTADMAAHLMVVATADNTHVTVRASARTKPGTMIPALSSGAPQTFVLNRYEILQIASDNLDTNYLECSVDPYFPGQTAPFMCRVDNDLTGTLVLADQPIAVFAGSACSIKPYNKTACDHLEEQIFPHRTWGKKFVAQQSHPLRYGNHSFAPPELAGADDWKIVASCPLGTCPQGTLLTLSTAPMSADVIAQHCVTGSLETNDCRLLGGGWVELKSKSSFTITADQPIAVAQFIASEDATDPLDPADPWNPQNRPAQGDPSMILIPPIEQWRTSYNLLTAPGFVDNYLSLAIDDTKVASVEVDGMAVTGFVDVRGTTIKVVNLPVDVGTHVVRAIPRPNQTATVGVTVYGFDSYVSYGYTGGLDLHGINSIDPSSG